MTAAAILNGRQLGKAQRATSAALDATDETVQWILDDAASGHHVRVVTAPTSA